MITKKQKEVLDFIRKYKSRKKYAPTLQEIRQHFRLASVSTAHHYIRALENAGYLNHEDNQPRAIDIISEEKMTKIPLAGTIAAGVPIEAIEEYETIPVPKNLVARSGSHFALRVRGDSMIDEGIFDGDTVIIRKQNTAENGETVVALLNNNEATLKKIYRVPGGFRLQPANPAIPAFTVKQLVVQGKVISVIRSYESKKSLLDMINMAHFSDGLRQIIEKSLREIEAEFKLNAEFEIWKKTEDVPNKEKFCLETAYTFLNEVLLLWICKDKKLLKFEKIQNSRDLTTLKKEAQKIYFYLFENNIFDWYVPNIILLREIADFLDKYDFSRIDRDILGKLYEQFIPPEERKRLGQFYTPESVIDYILDQTGYIDNIEDKKIIDLSCGSGGFTTRAAGRLAENLKKDNIKASKIIEKVIDNIYGLDINPFACYLAETNMLVQLLDLIVEAKRKNPKYKIPKINIFQTNTIETPSLLNADEKKIRDIKNKTGKFAEGFDFVVGNPPYLEAKKMNRRTKEICRQTCPDTTKGAFDLFICFIDKGLRLLKNGGRIGYIFPNKFLIANYAKKIRAELLEKYSIKEIIDVSECKIFENISVYPVIFIVENKKPKNNLIRTAEKIAQAENLIEKNFSTSEIKQDIYKRDDFVFFILPADKKQNALLTKLLSEQYTMLDNYLMLKWTISFHAAGLRKKFLFPEKPESKFAKKLIGGKSFAGNSDIERYKLNWGGWWINYDEELAKKYKNPLPPKEIFEQEKIIICQNALRLRATFDNQNYYCKDTFFVASLNNESKGKFNLKFFLALLNSKLLHYYYANIYKGTHVAGGYLHYLIGYLESLPVAQPSKKQQSEIVALVEKILKCKDRKNFRILDKEIDARIYELYGLSTEEKNIVENFI